MAREIELKIRLSDPEPFRQRLAAMAETMGPYTKEDTYYRGSGGSFRLRTSGGTAVACLKQKTIANGIETSKEIEFSVDRPREFEAFALALGFQEWYRKRKTGQAWRWKDVLIEEGEVSGLGWFAEFEVLLDDEADGAAIETARQLLLSSVEALGARSEDIEPRTYSQLLGHRGR